MKKIDAVPVKPTSGVASYRVASGHEGHIGITIIGDLVEEKICFSGAKIGNAFDAETAEILSDKEMMNCIALGLRELSEGKTVSGLGSAKE